MGIWIDTIYSVCLSTSRRGRALSPEDTSILHFAAIKTSFHSGYFLWRACLCYSSKNTSLAQSDDIPAATSVGHLTAAKIPNRDPAGQGH